MDPHAKIAKQYIRGVDTGKIVAGRLLRLAVRRHLEDLKHAGERGFEFDESKAAWACAFFPTILRHSSSQWHDQPFHLTPFQTFAIWCLFGWRRKSDGTRRFRKAYLTVAKKNGKTTLFSGIGLLMLVADDPVEYGAQIYVAATKKEQAHIMFDEAVLMVNKSPSLSAKATVASNNIAWPETNSYMRPLGSDSTKNNGWSPHAMLIDELCDWQEYHRKLWGSLTTAGGIRPQPLRAVACTAGDESSEIWEEEDDYATAVVESVLTGNIIDDEHFSLIARLDIERACENCDDGSCGKCVDGTLPADDPFDEKVWPKANPNIGDVCRWDFLRGQAREAKHKPTAKHDFLRYHCNLKVTSHLKVIDMARWAKGGCELSDWGGDPSYGAFDLGWVSDLASMSLVKRFHDGLDGNGQDRWRYEARSWSFIPEGTQTDLTREPWPSFIASGSLIVTNGDTTDIHGAFLSKLLEVTEEFNCVQWACDPHQARSVSTLLTNDHGIECFNFQQTHGMYNESLLMFLKAVADGRFIHGNDRLLEWCARHLICNKNHKNEMMPDKKRSKEKIDPIVACVMALGGAMTSQTQDDFWTPSQGVSL